MLAHLCTEHSNTPDVCIVSNGKMRCYNFPDTQRAVKHKKYLTEQTAKVINKNQIRGVVKFYIA